MCHIESHHPWSCRDCNRENSTGSLVYCYDFIMNGRSCDPLETKPGRIEYPESERTGQNCVHCRKNRDAIAQMYRQAAEEQGQPGRYRYIPAWALLVPGVAEPADQSIITASSVGAGHLADGTPFRLVGWRYWPLPESVPPDRTPDRVPDAAEEVEDSEAVDAIDDSFSARNGVTVRVRSRRNDATSARNRRKRGRRVRRGTEVGVVVSKKGRAKR
ncbi:hypothetical protein VTK26DRAFT_7861 [Humicola hyalothermophila]